jgi:hypothetical protein
MIIEAVILSAVVVAPRLPEAVIATCANKGCATQPTKRRATPNANYCSTHHKQKM